MQPANDIFHQIIQKFEPDSRLLRSWTLTGGVSAQVTALEVEQASGQIRKMIVRQHGAVDLSQNPQIAADEFKLLQIARTAGLAVPKPYYVDQSCEILRTPYIVIDYIEGSTDFVPANLDDYIRQLATHLARIHSVDGSQELAFLPNRHELASRKLSERPALLDDSISEGRIRDTLEATWPQPQHNQDVLLHGDYWPGNTLWKDNQLVAVIDWEDANLGDPLADLASSRLEILWAFGVDAMQSFTQHYLSIMDTLDLANLPYWDLFAALRPALKLSEWIGDPVIEQRMRDHHSAFIAEAFEKI